MLKQGLLRNSNFKFDNTQNFDEIILNLWAIPSDRSRQMSHREPIAQGRSEEMSNCERIAQVAQDKWGTMSNSLRSLRGNERMSDLLKQIWQKKSKILLLICFISPILPHPSSSTPHLCFLTFPSSPLLPPPSSLAPHPSPLIPHPLSLTPYPLPLTLLLHSCWEIIHDKFWKT